MDDLRQSILAVRARRAPGVVWLIALGFAAVLSGLMSY
jgi:hypothetical protein